jgi:hypothetical protein
MWRGSKRKALTVSQARHVLPNVQWESAVKLDVMLFGPREEKARAYDCAPKFEDGSGIG